MLHLVINSETTEVSKYLEHLSSKSNLDVLGIDAKLLSISDRIMSKCISNLINMILRSGEVPTELKSARVTPIFKDKGSPTNYGNYRPISCVPHVAKIMETNQQLKAYMFDPEFITGDQSAYRSGHWTETALQRVLIDLLDGEKDGLMSGMCFFDLAKCFDTIDHDILLLKLERYCVRGQELQLFKSYLENRSQTVRIGLQHPNAYL